MERRILGRTGREVSVVGLGTWQLGADWGEVTEAEARDVLEAATAAGVTFLDTADVYGDGRSEQVIGGFVRDHPDLVVATKMGRRAEQVPESYRLEAFRAWLDRSRRNLDTDTIDLVQLHCPPSATVEDPATYDALDTLVDEGVIAAYGLSVETVDQALAAIARPHVASVQIILNAFRLKPLEQVLPAARDAGVGIIARVPLASGLLSGRYDEDTTFAAEDHRSYNRGGEAFDVGETFSGVEYERASRPPVRSRRSSPSTAPTGRPRRRSRWRGSASSPGSARSSPARAAPSRLARTRPPPTSPRWRPSCSRASAGSTTRGSARRCTTAGEPGRTGVPGPRSPTYPGPGGGPAPGAPGPSAEDFGTSGYEGLGARSSPSLAAREPWPWHGDATAA